MDNGKLINWAENNKKQFAHVFSLLTRELSDEPQQLIRQASEIEAWNVRVHYWLAEINSFLDLAMLQARNETIDSEEKITAMDRKIMIDSMVADVRRMRDKVEGMADSIKQRLILAESQLAFIRAYSERTIMAPDKQVY